MATNSPRNIVKLSLEFKKLFDQDAFKNQETDFAKTFAEGL